MVVAPHGAGLANLLFVAEGTPVIEICYDDHGNPNARGMICPAMYAAMGANLHLPYWVVTADGRYDTAMSVDLPQLRKAVLAALDTVRAAHTAKRGGGGSTDVDGVGVGAHVVGLLKKLKKRCGPQAPAASSREQVGDARAPNAQSDQTTVASAAAKAPHVFDMA